MTPAPVSIVIVSRGRPEALLRTLTGVGQLHYPMFEVVVVADPAGLLSVDGAGWTGRIKTVLCDLPNISVARNLGIAAASGEIVAFIDDDAVPEPTWLTHLTEPFADPQVDAATGFVIGRNGITFQWQARDARTDGTCVAFDVDQLRPTVLTMTASGHAIKTEGTNMAFRRSVIAAAGGFDPVFRFYLEETDVNLRLGARTAIVPLAQVHHGFAPSVRRRADRVPRDLFEIGASLAAFLRKHHPGDPAPVLAAEVAAQRRRLVGHMTAGRIEPRDVGRILDSFAAGCRDGMGRPLQPLPPVAMGDGEFRRLAGTTGGPVDLAARSLWRRQALAEAKARVREGHVVSVILLSPSARRHRVRFDASGFWLQTGGIFGRSDPADRVFRFWTFGNRIRREIGRVALVRKGRETSQEIR